MFFLQSILKVYFWSPVEVYFKKVHFKYTSDIYFSPSYVIFCHFLANYLPFVYANFTSNFFFNDSQVSMAGHILEI